MGHSCCISVVGIRIEKIPRSYTINFNNSSQTSGQYIVNLVDKIEEDISRGSHPKDTKCGST